MSKAHEIAIASLHAQRVQVSAQIEDVKAAIERNAQMQVRLYGARDTLNEQAASIDRDMKSLIEEAGQAELALDDTAYKAPGPVDSDDTPGLATD